MIYHNLIPCFPLRSGVFILMPVTAWSRRVGSVCARVSFAAVWLFLSGNVGVCWSSIISISSLIWVKSWKLLQRLEKTLRSNLSFDVALLCSGSSPVDDVISFHVCRLAESSDPAQHILLSFGTHDIRTHPLMDDLHPCETLLAYKKQACMRFYSRARVRSHLEGVFAVPAFSRGAVQNPVAGKRNTAQNRLLSAV